MEKNKKESKYIVGSVICGLLTLFGIVTCIISMLGGIQSLWFLTNCIHIVFYVLISYYSVIGYKKPHGNLLKYIILIFSVMFLISISSLVKIGNTTSVILYAIDIGLFCYIAGRLAKAKENLVLIVIATVCLVSGIVVEIVSGGYITIGIVSPLVIWLDICVAYFLRYKEHREAGLEDARGK